MASSNNSFLLHGMRGQIGKQIVVKQYGDKTVISKYPDMSGVKYSKRQKKQQDFFKEAVIYAKAILADPVKKGAYARKAKRKGQYAYHYALQEYLGKK